MIGRLRWRPTERAVDVDEVGMFRGQKHDDTLKSIVLVPLDLRSEAVETVLHSRVALEIS